MANRKSSIAIQMFRYRNTAKGQVGIIAVMKRRQYEQSGRYEHACGCKYNLRGIEPVKGLAQCENVGHATKGDCHEYHFRHFVPFDVVFFAVSDVGHCEKNEQHRNK